MKKILCSLLTALIVLSFASCGSSKDSYSDLTSAETSVFYSDSDSLGFASYNGEYEIEKASSGTSSDAPDSNTDKIIYSADVTLESTEFDSSIDGINKLIEQYNGYIESSSISNASYSTIQSGSEYNRSASYTIRVPSENFNSMMNSFSALGNIPYSYVYTDNVTSQYYDTQARLTTYQAQESRMLELLDMADTVSEIIEIENELTEIRYKIESLQTTLNSWDKQVAYSTVYLTLREVSKYTPSQKITFGSELLDAITDGLSVLKEFILFLVSALPVIIVLAAIIYFVVKLIKCVSKKRRCRKAAKGKNKEEISNSDTPQN